MTAVQGAPNRAAVPSVPKFGHPVPNSPGIKRKGNFMEISNFKNLFLAELQEIASMEDQLSGALLRMAGAASHPALKRALIHHRAETETQKLRLETILQKQGADPAAHID